MSDTKQIQGSNAERAEGGLNPEDAFAEVDAATDHRLAQDARLQQNVRQQLKDNPGGRGTVAGRNNHNRD